MTHDDQAATAHAATAECVVLAQALSTCKAALLKVWQKWGSLLRIRFNSHESFNVDSPIINCTISRWYKGSRWFLLIYFLRKLKGLLAQAAV